MTQRSNPSKRRKATEELSTPKAKNSKKFEYENIPIEDVEEILGRMKWNDNVEKCLKWLREELEDEIQDRQESPENEWVERILVAQDETVTKYLQKTHFKSILRSARFHYPNHEQLYWRIGKAHFISSWFNLNTTKMKNGKCGLYHVQRGLDSRWRDQLECRIFSKPAF